MCSVHCIHCRYFYTNTSNPRAGLLQALKDPAVWSYKISRLSVYEGGNVVSPTHCPPSQTGIFLVLIYVTGWVDPRDTVRAERSRHWKIPMTPSGIEPATLRLVAQGLNQLRHRMAHQHMHMTEIESHAIKFNAPTCVSPKHEGGWLPTHVMCVGWCDWMTAAPCTVTAFAEKYQQSWRTGFGWFRISSSGRLLRTVNERRSNSSKTFWRVVYL